ncbi:MAG: ATP-binding SpoIIE family protein phosphatase [Cellvibrio sp.]|uniref:ATP-binding SpoIIE family protein phosphatase n=1 Tax=Cellvibrio sp. TaxID=1965322 RepID=UPI0031A15E83
MSSYGTQLVFDLQDISSVAVVRRAGAVLARELNFDETRAGQLALLITEAATNIVKHAGDGQMLLRALYQGEQVGIEVIALDKGPGIENLDWHSEDGNSTAGTYGIGLGTLRRLSQDFDIYSEANKGTVLWMLLWASVEKPKSSPWQIGAVCVPLKGEEVSGDNWAMAAHEKKLTLLVADGLGHGPEAAKASDAAVALKDEFNNQSPSVILQRAHQALQGTRGAAVAVGQINGELGTLTFAGVGNIAVCILNSKGGRHLVSHNGIIGSNLRKLQEFSESWERDALLVAHSDGINTRWDLDLYPGLEHCHPAIIAAVIYRDFTRGRDDATVVVVREH